MEPRPSSVLDAGPGDPRLRLDRLGLVGVGRKLIVLRLGMGVMLGRPPTHVLGMVRGLGMMVVERMVLVIFDLPDLVRAGISLGTGSLGIIRLTIRSWSR